MKAIILAAGRGSRMKDLTSEQPKCLVEVRGRSLLDWQLQSLRGAGIGDIALVTGYRREQLQGLGLPEFHNPRWSETNMVNSLACAANWLESTPCLVSYSDIFYAVEAPRALIACSAPLAVCFDPNWRTLWEKRFGDPLLDAESFKLTPHGTLAEIGTSPRSIDEIEGQYMGLLRFEPAGWREFSRVWRAVPKRERDKAHMTGTLQRVIVAAQIEIAAVPYHGEWGEVDSTDDLQAYSP